MKPLNNPRVCPRGTAAVVTALQHRIFPGEESESVVAGFADSFTRNQKNQTTHSLPYAHHPV